MVEAAVYSAQLQNAILICLFFARSVISQNDRPLRIYYTPNIEMLPTHTHTQSRKAKVLVHVYNTPGKVVSERYLWLEFKPACLGSTFFY